MEYSYETTNKTPYLRVFKRVDANTYYYFNTKAGVKSIRFGFCLFCFQASTDAGGITDMFIICRLVVNEKCQGTCYFAFTITEQLTAVPVIFRKR